MLLNFRLGSIPVRVHGSFFLVSAMLGVSDKNGLASLTVWLPVVFVGVLLHELGHALVGRSFGLTPQIDLIAFGGLTSWSDSRGPALGPGKRIAISLAGPFTGIAIGLAVRAVFRAQHGFPPFRFLDGVDLPDLVWTIFFVNFGWGIMNLLPILPMDGGNVLLQSLNWLTKGRGEKPARVISTGTAVVLAVAAYLIFRSFYGALMAGLFAIQNVQAYRAVSSRENDAPLVEVLKAGFAALEHGDPAHAVRSASDVLSRATDARLRSDAIRLLAFGYLLSRNWEELVRLMESPAASAIGDDELAKFERAARELEHPVEADRIGAAREKRRGPRF